MESKKLDLSNLLDNTPFVTFKYSDFLCDSYFHLGFGQSLVHVTSPAKLNMAILNTVLLLKSSSGPGWARSKRTSYQYSSGEPRPAKWLEEDDHHLSSSNLNYSPVLGSLTANPVVRTRMSL